MRSKGTETEQLSLNSKPTHPCGGPGWNPARCLLAPTTGGAGGAGREGGGRFPFSCARALPNRTHHPSSIGCQGSACSEPLHVPLRASRPNPKPPCPRDLSSSCQAPAQPVGGTSSSRASPLLGPAGPGLWGLLQTFRFSEPVLFPVTLSPSVGCFLLPVSISEGLRCLLFSCLNPKTPV